MTARQPTAFNKVNTGDPVIDRLQDRLVDSFRLITGNTIFGAGSFRLAEVPQSNGSLRFTLQYRTGSQWATIGHFDSAGVYTAGS